MAQLLPREPVPDQTIETLDHGTWKLSEKAGDKFTLMVFYRGLHCPICSGYLRDLQRHLGDLEERGVSVIALSSDSEERARKAKDEWKLDKLTIGHSLSIDDARRWGLYVSSGIGTTSSGVEEPEQFSEPGLFMIRPDGTLYFASIQTMPFARPHFDEMVKALDFVIDRDYPARGEVPLAA
ncbi:MAG: peroxiredoxin-like family protein [Geminicoccaceae bacterium]